MKEVRVQWITNEHINEWVDPAEIHAQPAVITTIAWFVHETDDLLCVASSRNARDGVVNGVLIIPKSCIIERKDRESFPGDDDD